MPERVEQWLGRILLANLVKEQSKEKQLTVCNGMQQGDGMKQDEELVQRVGNRLLRALHSDIATQARGRRMKRANNGYVAHLSRCKWNFMVIEEVEPNAVVLPNGAVIVHTGLLDLLGRKGAGAEARLAFILGHEIAHCCARHAAERLSFVCASAAARMAARLFWAWVMEDNNVEVLSGCDGHPDALIVSTGAELTVFELSAEKMHPRETLLNARGEAVYELRQSRLGSGPSSLLCNRTGIELTRPTIIYTRDSDAEGGSTSAAFVWLPAPTSAFRRLIPRQPQEPKQPWRVMRYTAAPIQPHSATDPAAKPAPQSSFDLWDHTNEGTVRQNSLAGRTSVAVDTAQELFFHLPKSRRNEHEADLIGMKLAGLAGYDTAAAIEALQALDGDPAADDAQVRRTLKSTSDLETYVRESGWLSTHPPSQARIKKLKQELAEMDVRASGAAPQLSRGETMRQVFVSA